MASGRLGRAVPPEVAGGSRIGRAGGAPTNPLSPPLEIGFDPKEVIPTVSPNVGTVWASETGGPRVWRAEH